MKKFVLTLALLCLLDPTIALRSHENLNVLVPNNDVNLQTKIKKLLNDDEVDREDFSDNEIESLSALKNPKIEKFLGRKADKENKVFDEKNKNNEANMIDYDVSFLSTVTINNVTSYSTEVSVTPTVYEVLTTANVYPTLKTTHSPSYTTTNVSFTPTVPYPWTTPNSTEGSPTYPTSPVNGSSTLNFTPTVVVTTTTYKPLTNSSSPSPSPTHNSSTTEKFFPSSPDPTLPENSTLTVTPTEVTTTTTYKPIYDDLQPDECILGKPDRKIVWVDDKGRLNKDFISTNYGDVRNADLSGILINVNRSSREFDDLKFLSVADNNLKLLPINLLEKSRTALKYLSLNGNDFSAFDGINRDMIFMELPSLRELDLRNCKLETIRENFIKNLTNLSHLYLSNNPLKEICGSPFPENVHHIDLSYNSGLQLFGLKVATFAFWNLRRLGTLDFSHTIIETGSVAMLNHLPVSLVGLSLCYSELPEVNGTFLQNATNLLYLDISGNLKLITERTKFGQQLSVLFLRSSNLHYLDWTTNLTNMIFLDLYDNNINRVSNLSFSSMTSLVKLNLEKNSIGNWYDKLFVQNRNLKFLNLRENKLSVLTNDMKEDLLSVKAIAIGRNDFECNCILQTFIHGLFEATRVANVSDINPFKSVQIDNNDSQFIEKVVLDTTRATLGVRNYLRPEYDVISRTYQKYYQMVEKSIEALKVRTTKSKSMILSRKLITQTDNDQEIGFGDIQTILFDYDEDDDDYECINATAKVKEPIIDLDLCQARKEETPPYSRDRTSLALSLYISIPLVIIISVLVIVVYWKWWYVRYFFVLCKNSAILTFMDDSDSGKDAIVTSKNDEPVETFLYDVFVSYSESNRDWVLDEFISNVEKRESINVCLHERDFQVGYGILENIVSCMDRSRCLLLLVSENFLLSQWCQFEMNLAQHRLLETRRDKLILVLLEDIPVRKQPKTLKYLMRTKTYIKWPAGGSMEEKNLFWKRLKKSIISSKWETENYGSIV